jgi:hypothetical protein
MAAHRSLVSSFFVFALLLQSTFGLNVDMTHVSVSGLSSGGFAAVQFHFAYSSSLIGVGVFAGGPYYCAQGALTNAETECLFVPEEISVSGLLSDAQGFASKGEIDDLSNLNGQPVYLYSGEIDTVVQRGVVEKLQQMYQQIAPSSNITTEFSILSEHCLPTLSFGNLCVMLESPYINKCNYDGAGAALQSIYKSTLKPATTANSNNIQTLNQQDFIPQGRSTLGVSPNAYVYVPTNCQSGSSCGLHVAFHGCNQNYVTINDDYYANGGFNGWAEANDIIVLYPQAAEDQSANPEGCFDWWGFTGSDYAFKSGVQLATTWNMINYLAQSNVTMIDF